LHRLFIAHVKCEPHGACSELRRHGLGASEIAPGERDSRAGVAERLRHGSSQSARTAGYEYRRAIEVRHPLGA
jgi:hypothetical protein